MPVTASPASSPTMTTVVIGAAPSAAGDGNPTQAGADTAATVSAYGVAGDWAAHDWTGARPARSPRKSASLRLATGERTRAVSWSQRASTPFRGPSTDDWSPMLVRVSGGSAASDPSTTAGPPRSTPAALTGSEMEAAAAARPVPAARGVRGAPPIPQVLSAAGAA